MLAFLGLGVALYVRAVRVARGRNLEVTGIQQAAFYGGVALWAVALISPVDSLAEDLLSLHMTQHLLLAELGAPLILVGLRAPVIFFFLPRPAMVALARRRTLRRVMRKLTTPLGAIATYALVLYGWHFAPPFEAALESPLVHVLQHQSFFFIAILVWIPALEPTRRRLRGELWKAGHIVGRATRGDVPRDGLHRDALARLRLVRGADRRARHHGAHRPADRRRADARASTWRSCCSPSPSSSSGQARTMTGRKPAPQPELRSGGGVKRPTARRARAGSRSARSPRGRACRASRTRWCGATRRSSPRASASRRSACSCRPRRSASRPRARAE